jgi:hypothetical protein
MWGIFQLFGLSFSREWHMACNGTGGAKGVVCLLRLMWQHSWSAFAGKMNAVLGGLKTPEQRMQALEVAVVLQQQQGKQAATTCCRDLGRALSIEARLWTAWQRASAAFLDDDAAASEQGGSSEAEECVSGWRACGRERKWDVVAAVQTHILKKTAATPTCSSSSTTVVVDVVERLAAATSGALAGMDDDDVGGGGGGDSEDGDEEMQLLLQTASERIRVQYAALVDVRTRLLTLL